MFRWIGSIVITLAVAACASAQPAITELKVKPEDNVYKDSAWNKPIVIKSADDAGKYFGKDALATISKEVDFKKQIVLLFAWRGSGGDKLEYQILESFPEQIPFTLKGGKTDDLRSHARVFALRSNVKWSVPGKNGPKGSKDGEQKSAARPIQIKLADPTLIFKIGGQGKLIMLTDVNAVENLVGKAAANSISDDVDFQKESLVLVSWTTSGPPDGVLKLEVKKDGAIVFYVQGPGGEVRGRRARIAADFFAVPKGAKVSFEAKER